MPVIPATGEAEAGESLKPGKWRLQWAEIALQPGQQEQNSISKKKKKKMKFCKGDESLEDEEHSGRPLEVDNDQLRAIIEVDPLTTAQEAAEELNVDHSTVIRQLKQIGKVKQLHKWVPHKLRKNV